MNTLTENLINWYLQNKRQLPWRETKDPYCIWVSEIMLQQTQVATVIPYYLKFIERFPTIQDLADATLEEVHQYWQGLGYYRRGENLWKGAKLICERWQGVFPKNANLVKEINGIGPYTTGAICSIAFNMPLPAVDGNVMRVISRLYCLPNDISNPKNRIIVESIVHTLLPNNNFINAHTLPNIERQSLSAKKPIESYILAEENLIGTFNQALMELGALICTPCHTQKETLKNLPKCHECPICSFCKAYQTNTVTQFPIKLKKISKPTEKYYVLMIYKENQLGLMKRPKDGLLANLWGLPMIDFESDKILNYVNPLKAIDTPENTQPIKYPKPITHVFTHKKWLMTPLLLNWSNVLESLLKQADIDTSQITYYPKERLSTIPIATAFKKVINSNIE